MDKPLREFVPTDQADTIITADSIITDNSVCGYEYADGKCKRTDCDTVQCKNALAKQHKDLIDKFNKLAEKGRNPLTEEQAAEIDALTEEKRKLKDMLNSNRDRLAKKHDKPLSNADVVMRCVDLIMDYMPDHPNSQIGMAFEIQDHVRNRLRLKAQQLRDQSDAILSQARAFDAAATTQFNG